MKSGLIKLLIFLVILSPFAYFGFSIYQDIFTVDPNSPNGEYTIEVESGQSIADVAIQLQKDDVVRNSSYFETIARVNNAKPLQVGEYTLNLPAKPSEIVNQLNNETSRIEAEIAAIAQTPTVNITFKEGWTLDEMIDELVANEVATREELEEFAQDPIKFSRETYEFLPDPLSCDYGDLSNCAKYYPEGYLYPDTYSFFVPSSPKDIFTKMLNNFDRKVWQEVQSQANSNFHEQIILASLVEKESGRTRGITAETAPVVSEERKKIASVLVNRLEQGIKLQSNPTVGYGTGFQICERTIELEGCRFLDDPVFVTKYNTYQIDSLPIGPVASPSIDNIQAALNPANTDYLFFVADDTGFNYFATTNSEHEANIQKVIEVNAQL